MDYKNEDLVRVLDKVDLGASVAEQDNMLESARVETSVFTDLLKDRVDLIPGTKGSGKSALYRIFVDFLPRILLNQHRVVLAHGVQRAGDQVFQVFTDRFEKMDENDFVNFWSIYLVSLANERFVKEKRFASYLAKCNDEVRSFKKACAAARIPEFEKPKSLRDVLDWALDAVKELKLRFSIKPPGDSAEYTLTLFGPQEATKQSGAGDQQPNGYPHYVTDIRDRLEAILKKASLTLWLMIDRLDEIFPRRSELETRALRGLLRTLRIFESSEIRVKVFLRDDILRQIVSTPEGFTALTHITARQADTLKWSEQEILTMIVNRLLACDELCELLKVDRERVAASHEYRNEVFYLIFPPTVHRGSNQSPTLRWIYTHTQDGNGVVTPRDVIDLLTRAKQRQLNDYLADPTGSSQCIIGATAIQYGLTELSKRKRETYLQAEFPHLWKSISGFIGGKTEYSGHAIRQVFGKGYERIIEDLVSIGVLRRERRRSDGAESFKIPFMYREGLELKQGKES